MTVHHEVLRAQLNKYKGVEMQIDGDAVLLGFRDPVSALAWCLATQQVRCKTVDCTKSLLEPTLNSGIHNCCTSCFTHA